MHHSPKSCDTFVVLPPQTKHGVVFGKNSDRPAGEVQELVYFPASQSSDPVKCTYIEVESAGATKAVILSKPGWMWGAEMGANEYGVAIGNEAVWTCDNDGDHDPTVKRLLGMDLVRLGLERGTSAEEALDVITQLLARYGQGGPCSESDQGLTYHNSFLIADPTTAWVLETSGKHWAAVQINSGYRNISNALSITTKIDKKSEGLEEYANEKGLWNGEGEFNFSKVFGGVDGDIEGDGRYGAGQRLLAQHTNSGDFKETDMFQILRDKPSNICRGRNCGFPTTGSQVSTLSSTQPSVHWFTATPDPSVSVFKPFIFTKNNAVSNHTRCPDGDKSAPHILYALHAKAQETKGKEVQSLLRSMEADCVKELEDVLPDAGENLSEFDELLKDCIETEVKFYR